MVSKKTLISIGSLFLVILFSTSIFLPIILNSQSISNNKKINNTNLNDFFINEKIAENAIKKEIIKYVDKKDILYKLTNYADEYFENKLSFIDKNVEENIMKIIKPIILTKTKIKEQNLFFQIRFKVLNKKELVIDLRWIDKNNYLFMYYDKNMIKLEI